MRTFGSFILISGLISLALGIYLIEDTRAHPIGDQSTPLIAGAFFLAGGIVPLFCLLHSVLRKHPGEWVGRASPRSTSTSPVIERDMRSANGSSQLPFQRIYVDSTRIRP